MVAGIVVDVDGDGAELGDFLLEGGEGVVILSGEGSDGVLWTIKGEGCTFLARRLQTSLEQEGP